MIHVLEEFDENILKQVFTGEKDLIIIKNADIDVIEETVNWQKVYISDELEETVSSLGIRADHELPWHIDRILHNPKPLAVNSLYCKKFEEGASPTYFSFMRRENILTEHLNKVVNYSYSHYKTQGLRLKQNNNTIKEETYHLVQEDDFGKYYFYTTNISDQNYEELYDDTNYLYIHNWSVGDFILWNNYTMGHRRGSSLGHSRDFIKLLLKDEGKYLGYRKLI